MYKMLYILIFSILLFSDAESENLGSTDLGNQGSIKLAPVKIGDKWGYINQRGEVVINSQFDYAMNFSEGLAAVKIGRKWGYAHQGGGVAIKPRFSEAESFSNGWAKARIDTSFRGGRSSWYGSVNREGKFFHGVFYFSEGLSPVRIGDKWGYINQRGEIVIKPQFNEAAHFRKMLEGCLV